MNSKYLTTLFLWIMLATSVPLTFAAGGRGEIQLENASASVKTVSIQLRGTENNQKVLHTVKNIVTDILNQSELAVDRVPVKKTPVATVPVYENLEIVIGATGDRISIILQEAGSEGEPTYFDYSSADPQPFIQSLQAHLYSRLNLRTKE